MAGAVPPLTALDTHADDLMNFAKFIESAGYYRYWATEHHSQVQSASPIVATAAVAATTSRLRVGTAGILLAYYSPRKILEDFALLEHLFGDRIDLGVASGVVAGLAGQQLLEGAPQPSFHTYARKTSELLRMLRDEPLRLLSTGENPPQLWICGKSLRSAELAGRLGTWYAFHHQLNQGPSAVDGVAVVNTYRAVYRSLWAAEPRVSVTCFGYCAENSGDAHAFWRTRPEHGGPSSDAWAASPSFLGSPWECKEQICAIAARYRADEVAVEVVAPAAQARWTAFGLIAEVVRGTNGRLAAASDA